jgi:hypothetical protein
MRPLVAQISYLLFSGEMTTKRAKNKSPPCAALMLLLLVVRTLSLLTMAVLFCVQVVMADPAVSWYLRHIPNAVRHVLVWLAMLNAVLLTGNIVK